VGAGHLEGQVWLEWVDEEKALRSLGEGWVGERAQPIVERRAVFCPCPPIDNCNAMSYSLAVIKSWRHKGLKDLFLTESKKGVPADMADRIRRRLDVLDAANSLKALGLPGFRMHSLGGKMKGRHSIRVTGNWRLTFRFEGGDVFEVDLEDYHGA
jgi:toxin HigB-1